MLLESVNFKNVFFLIFIFALSLDLVFSITVDYNNCERVNLLMIYPIIKHPEMRYYLFTKNNPIEGQELIDQNVTSVEISNFNTSWPTRIFISGWKTTPQNCKTAFLKDGYLLIGNYNFILFDWSDCGKKEYPEALNCVVESGRLLGEFTKFLNNNFDVSFDNIYLIGHSLGAHVAGAAGKSIKPYQYNTLFGLDPSVTGLTEKLKGIQLEPNDALYVEVISTDMFAQGYGLPFPIGQAIFYPNNGRRIQPPCSQNITNIIESSCSHAIAVDYFRHSITLAVQYCGIPTTYEDVVLLHIPNESGCPVLMGGEPSKSKSGHFYVAISANGPQPA